MNGGWTQILKTVLKFNSKINISPQAHSLDYLKKVLNSEARL